MYLTTGEGADALDGAAPTPNISTTQEKSLLEASFHLPDNPLVVIEPSKSHLAIKLRDLWAYRDLFSLLAWRDVKVRYKQAFLGAAWAVLQPLLTMLIFTFIFSKVARVPSDGIPYPIFAFAGLLPWTFLSNAVTNSSNSLVGSSHLITKVYFPRVIIPGAAVVAGLVDFAFSLALLAALMVYYQIAPTWQVLMLLPLTALTTLLALSIGMWFSALSVKYRDVKYALGFVLQIWMYVSPIAYPASVLPEKWRVVYSLNPLVGIVGGFRSALFGRDFNWAALGISAAVTLTLFTYAVYLFRKMERGFADII